MNARSPAFFYGRPFVIAALGAGLGIAAGYLFIGPAAYCLAGGAWLVCLLVFLLKLPRLPLFLLAFAAGLLRLQLAYPILPQPIESGELSGRIVQTPVRQTAIWRIVLDNASCNGNPIYGRILLTLPDARENYMPRYGQTLSTTASLSLPAGARNEGGMDKRLYYFTQGISCTAYAKGGVVTLQDGRQELYGALLALRSQSTERLIALLGGENGSLAAGVLHGDTAPIPEEVLADFRDSGLSHLLSVSGLHVSLLASAVAFLLRRCREGARFAAISAFVLFYGAFTAFSAPAVRAGLMAITLQLSRLLSRRDDPLSSLSLAFLLILSVSPFSLFSAGFQLSFSAMLGLYLLMPSLTAAFKRLPPTVSEPAALSLSASAATLPATAAHFHRMPLLALFANLLVTPLAALSLLPSGISLLLYPLWPGLSRLVAQIAGVTLTLIRSVAFIAAQPGVWNVISPTFGAAMLYFAVMAFASPYCRAGKHIKGMLVGVSAALCLLLWMLPGTLRPDSYIAVLDVSRGYAAHIHTPERDLLVGTSNALNSRDIHDYLNANRIRAYEAAIGDAKGAELAIGSHRLYVKPGAVETGSTRYETKRNGQMRFYDNHGDLCVEAYADDNRYAILMEELHPN
jgi:competence protein ComEC